VIFSKHFVEDLRKLYELKSLLEVGSGIAKELQMP
jgi:hypothetical protein